MKNIIFISFLIFLGCAKDGNRSETVAAVYPEAQQSQNGSYRGPQDPSCPRGPQGFRSRHNYCNDLRGSRWERRCTVDERYQQFREYCPGRRWQR